MTIHNLAFQGVFDGDLTPLLGLATRGVRHRRRRVLRAHIVPQGRTDVRRPVSTVSPTYAREIQRAPLGMGLEGVLAKRRESLIGMLNGIDDDAWNPATDPLLEARYDANTLDAKPHNKAALQRELGLEVRHDRPLLGVVSRLTTQKGSDLVAGIAVRDRGVPGTARGAGDRRAATRACARRGGARASAARSRR